MLADAQAAGEDLSGFIHLVLPDSALAVSRASSNLPAIETNNERRAMTLEQMQ